MPSATSQALGSASTIQSIASNDILPYTGQISGLTLPALQDILKWAEGLTSASPTTRMETIAPTVADVTKQGKAAKQQIDQLPRGGERNYLESSVDENTASSIGTALSNAFNLGEQTLGQIGEFGVSTNLRGLGEAVNASAAAGGLYNQSAYGKALSNAGLTNLIAGLGTTVGTDLAKAGVFGGTLQRALTTGGAAGTGGVAGAIGGVTPSGSVVAGMPSMSSAATHVGWTPEQLANYLVTGSPGTATGATLASLTSQYGLLPGTLEALSLGTGSDVVGGGMGAALSNMPTGLIEPSFGLPAYGASGVSGVAGTGGAADLGSTAATGATDVGAGGGSSGLGTALGAAAPVAEGLAIGAGIPLAVLAAMGINPFSSAPSAQQIKTDQKIWGSNLDPNSQGSFAWSFNQRVSGAKSTPSSASQQLAWLKDDYQRGMQYAQNYANADPSGASAMQGWLKSVQTQLTSDYNTAASQIQAVSG